MLIQTAPYGQLQDLSLLMLILGHLADIILLLILSPGPGLPVTPGEGLHP